MPSILVVDDEAGMRELVERRGQCGLLECRARLRRFAVNEERRRETGHVLQLGKLLLRQPRLAFCDDIAVAGAADRAVR